MQANYIYEKLANDFILDGITDNWELETKPMAQFLTQSYIKTSIGLMFDFTKNINHVFTSVFLNDKVIKHIPLIKDAMLFVHHPINEFYDSNLNCIIETLSRESITLLKENNISVFNLHIPLDNIGPYSTNNCFSEMLGFPIIDKFALYKGAYTGIICTTPFSTVTQMQQRVEIILGHHTKLYAYGNSNIYQKNIAIVVGCGHELEVMQEIKSLSINTLLTGVSLVNNYSEDVHSFDISNNINVIGGTHYSTEKYALIKLCNYFISMGINSTFIENEPCFIDL